MTVYYVEYHSGDKWTPLQPFDHYCDAVKYIERQRGQQEFNPSRMGLLEYRVRELENAA
jgi:hypothetical protein